MRIGRATAQLVSRIIPRRFGRHCALQPLIRLGGRIEASKIFGIDLVAYCEDGSVLQHFLSSPFRGLQHELRARLAEQLSRAVNKVASRGLDTDIQWNTCVHNLAGAGRRNGKLLCVLTLSA